MQDQLASAGPALGPSSSPQPQTPGLKRKLPWLPSAHDFTRLWAPALVLIGLTCTFDARGASPERSSYALSSLLIGASARVGVLVAMLVMRNALLL